LDFDIVFLKAIDVMLNSVTFPRSPYVWWHVHFSQTSQWFVVIQWCLFQT